MCAKKSSLTFSSAMATIFNIEKCYAYRWNNIWEIMPFHSKALNYIASSLQKKKRKSGRNLSITPLEILELVWRRRNSKFKIGYLGASSAHFLPELHSPEATIWAWRSWADFLVLILDINFLSRVCSRNSWPKPGEASC